MLRRLGIPNQHQTWMSHWIRWDCLQVNFDDLFRRLRYVLIDFRICWFKPIIAICNMEGCEVGLTETVDPPIMKSWWCSEKMFLKYEFRWFAIILSNILMMIHWMALLDNPEWTFCFGFWVLDELTNVAK